MKATVSVEDQAGLASSTGKPVLFLWFCHMSNTSTYSSSEWFDLSCRIAFVKPLAVVGLHCLDQPDLWIKTAAEVTVSWWWSLVKMNFFMALLKSWLI